MSDQETIKSELETLISLNTFETIVQIMPFGANSLACLTSEGRILTPGNGFGQWVLLPTPPTPPQH